jgi:tetratricopeptide (TPR) repeat protein
VDAYRNAVFYSRDDVGMQFRLAQALLAAGRPREARPYLRAAWREEPAAGRVNLELARLDAADGRNEDAVRHYHGAIHGLWDAGRPPARQVARRELIALLMRAGARQRAVAEVLDWKGTLDGADASGRAEAGALLLRLDEPRLALGAYREALRTGKTTAGALAGAGTAAARIGDWRLARTYLRRAPDRDEAAERLLLVAEHAVTLDPWAPRLRTAERGRRARLALDVVRERIAGCEGPLAAQLPALRASLEAAARMVQDRALQRDPQALDAAFRAVVSAEETAALRCGPGRPVDDALLSLGRAHADDEPDDGAPPD